MEIISEKEQLVLDWIKNDTQDKYVFLDIGANKGFYSEALIKHLPSKIEKIYCFEPVKENFDICIQKFKNNNLLEIFQKACSNQNKTLNFFQIISKNIAAEGLSSLNYRPVFKNYKCVNIDVECIILNEFLNIDSNNIFVKIDVEGHELEVLEGLSKYFEEVKIKCVQFEYGDCMLEQGKNLNDIQLFISNFKNYKICDFDINLRGFIDINESNINDYINKPWNNLYIIKNESKS